MNLGKVTVGPFEVNCYLYWDSNSQKGIIIDPGAEAGHIIDNIRQANFIPQAILLTHGHGDHIAAIPQLKEKYDLPVYIGENDKELLLNPDKNLSALLGEPLIITPPDYLLEDEQLLDIRGLLLKVLSTPGHTPGGVCFLDEKEGLLFTGDTLFYGSIGRTDLVGGSYETLIASIHNKILTLPDEIVCYPGHGPQTTVGGERINNPFLKGNYFV